MSSPWEATSRWDTQEFPNILWNHNVHFCVHKSPPLAPIMSHMNPVISLYPVSVRPISMLSSHLHLGLPNSLFLPGFHIKTRYALLFQPMSATCLVILIFFDLIILIIFREIYKLWAPYYAVFSGLGPNILFSLLFSNAPSPCAFLHIRNKVSHPYTTTNKIITDRRGLWCTLLRWHHKACTYQVS
jgi:hypothetical protein